MVPWLTAPFAHPQDAGSIPSMHMTTHKHLKFQFQGLQNRLLSLMGNGYPCCSHTYMQAKYSVYKIKNNLFKKYSKISLKVHSKDML